MNGSQWRPRLRGVVRSAMVVLVAAIPASGQQPFCLHDADGDGHPLFGNPEGDLDAFNWELVPTHGATGDLDGDGDPDAVSVNCWWRPADNPATQASILLNHGDGTFTPVAAYDPGDYPTCVAIGDLNGDGLNDLAVTNEFTHAVSVLINAGGATFPSRVSFPTGGQKPRSVVIVDLDGDDDADLAVANAQSNSVSVLLNLGQAAFTTAVSYPVANNPDASAFFGDPFAFGGPYLAAGDLDDDGDADLVVPAGPGASVLRNNGAGTFAPHEVYATGEAAWAVAIGDVTCDGWPDVVTADYSNESVSVLSNAGAGTFDLAGTYTIIWGVASGAYHPATVALGDLDHDDDLDLVVGTVVGYTDVPVLMNQGNGTFGPPLPYDAASGAEIVALDHLNADGHLDLAAFALQYPQERLCVRLNDGAGTLITDETNYYVYAPPSPLLYYHASQIEFVDLDGDSDLDLILLSEGLSTVPGTVAVQFNDGAGNFTSPVHYLISDHDPRSMVVADLDGDGDMDIAVCGPELYYELSPGRVTLLFNNGGGELFPEPSILTGGTHSYFAVGTDVDADGDVDLVTANAFSSSVSVLLNQGYGTFATPVLITLASNPLWVTASDLNMDGLPDLVFTKFAAPESLNVMWNTGDGNFVAGPAYMPSPHIGRVAAGDFDGDDDPDLVVTSRNFPYESVTMTVLHNDGSGTFINPEAYWIPGTSIARCVRVGDLDVDGDDDVLLSTDGAVSVFLNDGEGPFGPGFSYGTGEDVQSVTAGDLDGDGDIDIGTANYASHTFSIIWNRACASLPPAVSADLDSDGDVDLADYGLLAPCLSGPVVDPAPCPEGVEPDLDGDDDVDLYDATLLFNAFGQ